MVNCTEFLLANSLSVQSCLVGPRYWFMGCRWSTAQALSSLHKIGIGKGAHMMVNCTAAFWYGLKTDEGSILANIIFNVHSYKGENSYFSLNW